MLGLFRKVKKTGKSESAAPTSKPKNPHFIHDADAILKILKALQNSSTVISLYFPDQPGEGYGSSLIKVDRGSLLLDQVNHPKGHAELLAKKSFRALTKYQEVTITFDCRLVGIVKDGDLLRYRVAFPERLFYPQLRESFRIQVRSLRLPIHIQAKDELGKTGAVVGWVEDIGPNGIGFVLEADLLIRKLDTLRYCVLKVAEDRRLTFDIQVRNVRSLANGQRRRIGGKFVNLSRKNAALIHREISRLQRLLRAEEKSKG